ncbi:hypothetical protein [Sinanaerobacter sp. ZZT-01]|uniref:hypothetical protein n=1 Tax=Sinanaerobacter sp. ZZT-01 TaxID=3111540 RepID=UPI002D79408F|nr:hypothetical protein [Sinanaerobacter sp. ZZT-01]WRR92734.1 hypothetical protein U5921_11855 [Sinanaerobacter sp. ZZT-01]
MKKFIPIVGLLIVGLVILSGCSTELPKEDSEDIKVEVSTGDVEYTHAFRYGCTLEGDTVFVTVDNTNTEFQELVVKKEDSLVGYLIAPLSTKTIEIPISESFDLEFKVDKDTLRGFSTLAEISLTQLKYTPEYDKEGNIIKDLKILEDFSADTRGASVRDELSLSYGFSTVNGAVKPNNIKLISKQNAVSEKVGDIVLSFSGKLDRTNGLKVTTEKVE